MKKMYKIIIAGGRDFNDISLVNNTLGAILPNGTRAEDVQIISGGARGADKLGEQVARDNNTNLAIFPAQWDLHGKSAGYKRNELMAANADILVAFWDGKSRGTNHMINIATDRGLQVHVVKYE